MPFSADNHPMPSCFRHVVSAATQYNSRLKARLLRRHPTVDGHDEEGFVLVWAATVLMVMLTFAGFAIDIGNWHLQAAKIQRFADAAAMAGVVKMPDESAARQVALETLAKNGIVPSATVDVTVTAVSNNRLSVKVHDKHVDTAFAGFILDHIALSRTSTALHRDAIAMGNPTNQIGTGNLFAGSFKDVPYHGFWLSINGHCSAAEFGDPYASRYDGNAGTADGTLPTVCDGSRGELTPLYNPITALDGGYNYIIDVPDSGQTQYLYLYDAPFAPEVKSKITGLRSTDGQTRQPADHLSARINTNYRLYQTPGKTKTDYADDVLLKSKLFPYTYSNTNACVTAWCTIDGSPLTPGTYRLNVTTPYSGDGRAYGNNSYAIRVAPSPSGEVGFNLEGANQYTCDTRLNALCPHVYALNAFSILTHGSASGEEANVYLADIAEEYQGSPMRVEMFDAGDQSRYMQLVRPDQLCMPFKWSTPAFLNAEAMSGSEPSEDCSSSDARLRVSGTSTQITGRVQNVRFNDRWVTLATSVPANYPEVVNAAEGDTWWRIRYIPNTSEGAGRDHTTWRLQLDDGGPVHLVRNP